MRPFPSESLRIVLFVQSESNRQSCQAMKLPKQSREQVQLTLQALSSLYFHHYPYSTEETEDQAGSQAALSSRGVKKRNLFPPATDTDPRNRVLFTNITESSSDGCNHKLCSEWCSITSSSVLWPWLQRFGQYLCIAVTRKMSYARYDKKA